MAQEEDERGGGGRRGERRDDLGPVSLEFVEEAKDPSVPARPNGPAVEEPRQVVREISCAAVPQIGILLERLHADGLEVGIDRGVQKPRGHRILTRDAREDLFERSSSEGRLTRDHLVQRRAQSPHVRTLVDPAMFAEGLFGTHVGRSSDHDSGDRGSRIRTALEPGQAEVDHDAVKIGGEKDVAGLEVSMEDAVRVRVGDAFRRFLDRPDRLGTGHPPAGEGLFQGRSVDPLHDAIGPADLLAHVEQPHDARMMEPCRGLRLSTEEHQRLLVVDSVEHLDRDGAIELSVARREHDGHASATELAKHFVSADTEPRSGAVVGVLESALPRFAKERGERGERTRIVGFP